MAQYQNRLQGPGLPRGAAIATATPRRSTALMEKTRDLLPARELSGSNTNVSSSSFARIPMDEKLCQLIREVLRRPDGSENQQREMSKLLQLVPNLPGIYKSLTPTLEQQDGFNRALVDLSGCNKEGKVDGLRRFVEKRNLDLTKEDASNVRVLFVRWFNRIIKNKIAEVYREKKDKEYLILDAPISEGDGKTTYGEMISSDRPTGIDGIIEAQEKEAQTNLCQTIKDYLETDPEGILRKCHPEGYPQANCQELVKKRYLKTLPEKWKNLAQDLKVPYGTVTAHWKRKCVPLVREIASKIIDNFS